MRQQSRQNFLNQLKLGEIGVIGYISSISSYVNDDLETIYTGYIILNSNKVNGQGLTESIHIESKENLFPLTNSPIEAIAKIEVGISNERNEGIRPMFSMKYPRISRMQFENKFYGILIKKAFKYYPNNASDIKLIKGKVQNFLLIPKLRFESRNVVNYIGGFAKLRGMNSEAVPQIKAYSNRYFWDAYIPEFITNGFNPAQQGWVYIEGELRVTAFSTGGVIKKSNSRMEVFKFTTRNTPEELKQAIQ